MANHYRWIVLSASLLFGTGVYAADVGGYIGLAVGRSDDAFINDTDNALKAFAGYNWRRDLGVEVAFVDLGDFGPAKLQQNGLSVHVLGYLPLSSSIDLLGRIGLFDWEVRTSSASDSGTDLSYGLGAELRVSKQVMLRAEWETYKDVSGGDVDLLAFGASIRF